MREFLLAILFVDICLHLEKTIVTRLVKPEREERG